MSLLDNAQIQECPAPTEAELLKEAKAWGFDDIETWIASLSDVYDRSGKDQRS